MNGSLHFSRMVYKIIFCEIKTFIIFRTSFCNHFFIVKNQTNETQTPSFCFIPAELHLLTGAIPGILDMG